MAPDRLQRVLDCLDALNREDPNTDLVEGIARPRELAYAERLTGWVLRLEPQASEALRIAARGQHVRRWTIPRERYERTRRGYLKWRETLKTLHADTVAGVMQAEGYDEPSIARVRRIILKKDLATDSETQTIEDALCLLFLEMQFHDLRRKTPDATMVQVLRKTWGKMSERARAEALRLSLAPDDRAILDQALNG